MRLFQSIGFVFLAVVSTAVSAFGAEHSKEPLAKVKQEIDGGKAILVDVREKNEWDAGHLEVALFLPLSGLQDGVTKDELKPLPKDKTIFIHCRSGKRAVTAANILDRQGYKVQPLKPGYNELISAGFAKSKE